RPLEGTVKMHNLIQLPTMNWLASATLLLCAVAQANTGTVAKSVAELLTHTSDSPEKGVPFDIVAEVTFPYGKTIKSFTIKDDSGSIAISDERECGENDRVTAGDVIRVQGITDDTIHGIIYPGCRNLTLLSRKTPQKPTAISVPDFLSGEYDYRPVRIQGLIRDAFKDEIDPEVTFLILASEGHSVYVVFNTDESDSTSFNRFVGAQVDAEGLCRPSAHGTRRQIGRFLKAESAESVRILTPPEADPFNVPDITKSSRLRASELSTLGRLRTSGHVTAVWQDRNILLKTKDGKIVRIDLAKDIPPRYGQFIEVAGLPETDLYNINLSRAIWRPAIGEPFHDEQPEYTSAATLMSDGQGRLRINTGFHGKAICIHGMVRNLPADGNNDGRLYMESDRYIVPIDVSTCPNALHDISSGCRIEASGTCVMEIENWKPSAPVPRVKGFMIIVRKPDDIRILSYPPWWTPGRLLAVISGLLAALTGIFVWNRSLNRLAERRGRELTAETMARASADLKVGERTRLAIELHDSLSQNLTGVSLEIAAATSLAPQGAEQTLQHLNIATKTLKSCRDELRNCIWDLRNDALEQADMNEAIRRTLCPHVNGVNLTVCFNVPRELLSDNTTHALLRMIRELV
ncbi:MAG: hypothetical protein IKK82_01970, partial [Kiritimatiellae bacterium]|nr:hypothetical protein [Kiritimatiellia bacterium]